MHARVHDCAFAHCCGRCVSERRRMRVVALVASAAVALLTGGDGVVGGGWRWVGCPCTRVSCSLCCSSLAPRAAPAGDSPRAALRRVRGDVGQRDSAGVYHAAVTTNDSPVVVLFSAAPAQKKTLSASAHPLRIDASGSEAGVRRSRRPGHRDHLLGGRPGAEIIY